MGSLSSAEEIQILIKTELDIVTARKEGRELAIKVGFTGSQPTLIATAISEVARNIIKYAKQGEVILTLIKEETRSGIQIIAQDQGPGISNIESAMQDGYSTGNSLGIGLPGAKRLMDEFDIRSAVGKGTTVTMTKWVT
ncbi:MAG: anti-sigma regulatory factor [Bdellovibrionia bacterium]